MNYEIQIVNDPSYSFEVDEVGETPSSLLIPKDIVSSFQIRIEEFDSNKRKYLSFLVLSFRAYIYSGLVKSRFKAKLEYQSKYLDLKKISLRPKDDDWSELKNMAWFLGMSICKTFVLLLELDLKGVAELILDAIKRKAVPTVVYGSWLEFTQNVVHYEDKSEIQRRLRMREKS